MSGRNILVTKDIAMAAPGKDVGNRTIRHMDMEIDLPILKSKALTIGQRMT